ncbi:hypothetical protein AYO21_08975 [Fonsecaea monophora]|uniref:Uncharacterized protein n=2 Tax=Fonsecaea TaxID=40354 RepID=A0A178CYQ0_9EURO|nr:hypothetical protein AYO20_06207 [Fonsecaea nubica]XP_022508754.1 hypothetical protein AYO21_08975 [Fonsecaea monophora]KAH0842681.1 3-oxoacyl-[acyl-carrier-protein] reductase FabG [Fonsecaea pedrosoi]OAG36802.1 hypothetical protein AYO21_08975 [Fonsecaea monophora]OAL34577.1 hypothetical protein AYO20_06207 [Fonsecaea nubica]
MADLQRKSIIVTGGASGIGLATVTQLLELGARVAVGDLALETPSTLTNLNPASDNFFYQQLDVTSRQSVQGFIAKVLEKFGQVDGLVNNAGICPNEGEIASDDTFDRIMAVNLKGVWNVGTEVIRRMMEQESRGVIVNTASDAALKGIKGLAAYTASKHAVLGLTRVWCKEWTPKGIRVNAVAPGVTDTPMVAKIAADHESGQEATASWLKNIPMGRFGQPGEIASVICFLLSKDSSFMSGQVLRIGGGEGE